MISERLSERDVPGVQVLETSRQLDKAASKGIVHKRTAARRKSRLAKAANKVTASAPAE